MIRRTLAGAVTGWIVFLILGFYMNASIGAPVLSNWGPLLLFSVIGLTVGGLVAPLVHGVRDYLRDRTDEEADRTSR